MSVLEWGKMRLLYHGDGFYEGEAPEESVFT